jgi:hypothetical protein
MENFVTARNSIWDRARQIHEVLLRIASRESLRIGFPSPSLIDEAFVLLQRHRFRKPLLASKKEWTRRAIIFEPNVYQYLWPHVELEFVVEGEIRFFNGAGKPRRFNPALAHIEALGSEVYWSIDLNDHYPEFAETIEGADA